MKVVEIKKHGGPEVLYIGSRPIPKPNINEFYHFLPLFTTLLISFTTHYMNLVFQFSICIDLQQIKDWHLRKFSTIKTSTSFR